VPRNTRVVTTLGIPDSLRKSRSRPTRSKATSRSSNAACAVSINTARKKHLHRYLAEFDFRYNTRTVLGYTDFMRAEIAAAGIKGKRLTYRRPYKQGHAEAH
jgi:hypothetical protein